MSKLTQLRTALAMALDSLTELASDYPGDAPDNPFNDGGHAREACRALRTALGKS